MSKSFSATLTRAPTSARREEAPNNQVEPQESRGTPAPSLPSSVPSRHFVAIPSVVGLPCMASAADPVGLPAAAEAAVESPILTVDELAALLRLNRKTVYDALSRGEIPGARRVGSTYRILRAAVIDWLASGQGRVSHSKRLK